MKSAHEYAAEVLSDDAPLYPAPPETFAPVIPEPVAKEAAPPQEILSGAAWQAIQDASTPPAPVSHDIDPFDGSPL